MTTRASTARGQDKQQFQGRVRKWRKQWDLASDTAKYKLLKWVPTGTPLCILNVYPITDNACMHCYAFLAKTLDSADERTEDRTFSRFPNLRPVST